MPYDVGSTWAQLEELILDPVADFVEHISSEMPVETDWGSSMKGSWYLSARQHVLEFVLFNAVFFVATLHLFRKVLAPGSPQDVSFRTFAPPSTPCRGERLMLATTLFSFATAVAHKCVRGSTIFLLQPCHVSAMLLLYVLIAPKTSRLPHVVFNIYLYILWGTITALVFPDLRDYDLFFEVENFFLEHCLLLVVPAYLVYSGRVHVWPPSLPVALLSYTLKCLYHSLILSAFALLRGANLNYVLSPPPISIMHSLGIWYRMFMYMASLILTIATRYVAVEFVIKLLSNGSPKLKR